MEKYIIALDLDETLLKDDKTVSNRTLKTLQECKNKNCKIVISSTRGYGSCEKIAKQISADYVCCQSGNMIVEVDSENIIYQKAFSKPEIETMLKEFTLYTNNIMVDSVKNLYGGVADETATTWGVIPLKLEEIPQKQVFKVCVFYNEQFKDKIVEFCNNQNYVCRPMRGAPFMLITQKDSDKYYALEKLANILNVTPKQIVVFGDDDSDLLSIQKAGVGVAMSNSRESVLKNAKNIAESNNDDGVAKFLEKMFLI